jgi:hypothetical protein
MKTDRAMQHEKWRGESNCEIDVRRERIGEKAAEANIRRRVVKEKLGEVQVIAKANRPNPRSIGFNIVCVSVYVSRGTRI